MATLAKKMESCGVEPNWLDLPRELIESIMKKLLLVDKVRLKAVCKSWNKAATSYLWSHREKSPCLILPQEKVEEEEKDDDNDNKWNIFQGEDDRFYYSCFINFADQEQKRYKVNMYKGLGDDYYGPRCVGSSYGWLIIFDQTSLGCLFNPFTECVYGQDVLTKLYPDQKHGPFVRGYLDRSIKWMAQIKFGQSQISFGGAAICPQRERVADRRRKRSSHRSEDKEPPFVLEIHLSENHRPEPPFTAENHPSEEKEDIFLLLMILCLFKRSFQRRER